MNATAARDISPTDGSSGKNGVQYSLNLIRVPSSRQQPGDKVPLPARIHSPGSRAPRTKNEKAYRGRDLGHYRDRGTLANCEGP